MWLGGISNNIFLTEEQQQKIPAIAKLAKNFSDFQNSPYRGEYNQITNITYGEIKDILCEFAKLYKNHQYLENLHYLFKH